MKLRHKLQILLDLGALCSSLSYPIHRLHSWALYGSGGGWVTPLQQHWGALLQKGEIGVGDKRHSVCHCSLGGRAYFKEERLFFEMRGGGPSGLSPVFCRWDFWRTFEGCFYDSFLDEFTSPRLHHIPRHLPSILHPRTLPACSLGGRERGSMGDAISTGNVQGLQNTSHGLLKHTKRIMFLLGLHTLSLGAPPIRCLVSGCVHCEASGRSTSEVITWAVFLASLPWVLLTSLIFRFLKNKENQPQSYFQTPASGGHL